MNIDRPSLRQRILWVTFVPFALTNLAGLVAYTIFGLLLMLQLDRKLEEALYSRVSDTAAARLPPLSQMEADGKEPEVIRQLKLINPEIDPFVLDADGRVLFPQESLPLGRVNPRTLEAAIAQAGAHPAYYAEDPRDPQRSVLFSAAPLPHGEKGFLYLVIRSRILEMSGSWEGFGKLFLLFLSRFTPFTLLFTLLITPLFTISASHSFRRIVKLIQSYSALDASPLQSGPPKFRSGFFGRESSSVPDSVQELAIEIYEVAASAVREQQALSERERRRRGAILGIVHDVRGPLTGIKAAVETMDAALRRTAAKPPPMLIAALGKGIASIRRFAGSLSEAATADSLGEELSLSAIDLVKAADSALASMLTKSRAAEIDLELFVNGERIPDPLSVVAPILVHGDLHALERALANLLENAIRHTPPGGSIQIRLNATDDGARVEVLDTGAGIPPEELPFIFELFHRGKRQQLTEGTGVGLTTVRKIIDLHRGSIQVESVLEKGTRFSLFIPGPGKTREEGTPQDVQAPPSPKKGGFFLALLWPLAIALSLVLMPHKSDFFSTVIHFNLGILNVLPFAVASSRMTGMLGVLFPFLPLLHWSMQTSNARFGLNGFIGGCVLGFLLLYAQRVRQVYVKTMLATSVLGVVSAIIASYIVHVTWEDELARSAENPAVFGEAVRDEVEALAAATVTLSPERRAAHFSDSFANFRALAPKTELCIWSQEPSLIAANANPQADILAAISSFVRGSATPRIYCPDSRGHPGHFASRQFSSPRRPIFTQHELRNFGTPALLTIAHRSDFFCGTFNAASLFQDLLFALLLILHSIPVVILLLRWGSRPFERVLDEIRGVISGYREKGRIISAEKNAYAFGRPVVEAMEGLAASVSIAREKVEQADIELKTLSARSAEEYYAHAEMLRVLVDELEEETFRPDSSGHLRQIQELLLRIQNLVEPQIVLTQALFSLTQTKYHSAALPVSEVRLDELAHDAASDLLSLCGEKRIVVQNNIPEGLSVSGNPDLLRQMIFALLDGLIKTLAPGSRIILHGSREHQRSVLSLESPAVSAFNLGLIVANDLCAALHAVLLHEPSPGQLSRITIHFRE